MHRCLMRILLRLHIFTNLFHSTMSQQLLITKKPVPLNYSSYDLPFVVRFMQPKLFKDNDGYHCLPDNCKQVKGCGLTGREALDNWTALFRKHINTMDPQKANEYIHTIRQSNS